MDNFLDFGLDVEDEEIGVLILTSCAYVVLMWMTGRMEITQSIPRHIRDTEKGLYLRTIIASSDINCRNLFRMDIEVFFNLSTLLRSRGLLHDT